ncbi:uncharacterized protein wu:fa19b12 [Clupea harengus]|uniref:Uncharacterized protein wu:fa19b12 n=1 Tax=Clupea harengus TaxID=7950 RepID=A0A8M1KJA2_CLUHA|nr:uncharacterized protein wu:fa19b12 [Clupea harengus]
MTKRRAEGVMHHDSPHKRLCFQSLCNNDTTLPGIRVVQDADASSLLSFLSNHCRKRNYVDDRETQELSRPRKKSFQSKTSWTVLTDNENNSGRFREAGVQSQSVAQEVASKKRSREENQLHEAEYIRNESEKAVEDVPTFNTFQFWRAPLPQLDMSLLQNDKSPGPTATQYTRDVESMET